MHYHSSQRQLFDSYAPPSSAFNHGGSHGSDYTAGSSSLVGFPSLRKKPLANRDELSYWILFPITMVMVRSLLPIRYRLPRMLPNLVSGTHGRSTPLRYGAPPKHAQTSHPPSSPRTAFFTTGYESAQQLRPVIRIRIYDEEELPRCGLQGRGVLERPRQQREACCQPDDGSCRHGGHDGHDEGQYDDDGSADDHYGLDQCLFFGICH